MSAIIPKKIYRESLIDISYLTLIIGILYFFCLGKYSLFTPDEGRYSEVAREMVASANYIVPKVNGVVFLDKPIFYYWLQATAIHFFGVKEFALRFFPALVGMLGCLITYICGRSLYDRNSGILAALILATCPLYFGGTHYANLDLEVAVFISASLLCFVTGIATNQKVFVITAWIFTALAFLTKGLIAIFFPLAIMGLWLILLKRFELLKNLQLLWGLLIFAAISLPWYLQIQIAQPEFFYYFFVTQHFHRFLSTVDFNNPAPFWFYIPVICIGLFPWLILSGQAIKQTFANIYREYKTHSIELFLLIWICTVFIFFSIPQSKIITYILPIFPPIALLTGVYVAKIWRVKNVSIPIWTSISTASWYFILGIFALLISKKNLINFLPEFHLYLILLAALFFISGLIIFISRRTAHLHILVNFFGAIFSLLMITYGADNLNTNTTKPLVTKLKKIIQPNDEVVTYFKYYQDLPLYLNKRITIVTNWEDQNIYQKDNWVRELTPGRLLIKKNTWLIDEDEFWKRYYGQKRLFIFLNKNYFNQFKKRAWSYFYLDQFQDIILLSNQPTFLSADMKARFFKIQLLHNKNFTRQNLS